MYRAAQGGFTNATDVADYLVKKGIPFRSAHEIVGKMVLYCLDKNIGIDQLSLEECKLFSIAIEEDVYKELSLETCVAGRNIPGGPARESVLLSIAHAKEFLNGIRQ